MWKSTDVGATWTNLGVGVNTVFPLRPLDDDTNWSDFPIPTGVSFGQGGNDDIGSGVPGWGAVLSDGVHDIILTSNFVGGAFRYVLPAE